MASFINDTTNILDRAMQDFSPIFLTATLFAFFIKVIRPDLIPMPYWFLITVFVFYNYKYNQSKKQKR